MKFPDKWWTSPAESEAGKTVIITGRDGLEKVQASGKYIYRLDVSWDYEPEASGMPSDADARIMEEATDALLKVFDKNTAAVMTGIYTGDGRRDWIFYTKNLKIFSVVFNNALEPLDQMPLEIEADEDGDWSEYREMRDMTYVPPED